MTSLIINSSSDISSDSECNKVTYAFNDIGTQQPLITFAKSGDSSHSKDGSQVSAVTKNSTMCSGETMLQRRVIKSKDSEEETITYRLKLHPDSMKYTFSTTEPRKVSFYTEKHLLAHQGTSGYACHNRMTELPSQKRNSSRNSNHVQCRSNGVRMYEEKSTYCRPVVNLHTAEFVEKTIDKNNRLRYLVRDIVEAREKAKKQEAWNNFINGLKTKHGYNNYSYETIYVPKQYQLEPDNILSRYNLSCQCGAVRSWRNDHYDPPKNFEYIMRPYPNEILCYPISSAAHMKFKNQRLNDSPIPKHLTTDCILKENPRKRKRRHALAQTSAITANYTVDSRYHTFKTMKDESEGNEICLCFAAVTTDEHTITDGTGNFERTTATNLERNDKRSHGSDCFCKKDKSIAVTQNEFTPSENEKNISTCSTEVDTFLKDFMKKDEEREINDSTKQSGVKKINSESQQDENYLGSSAQEKEEKNHQSSFDSESQQTKNISGSPAQEKVEKNHQSLFDSESQQNENRLGSSAQEKEEKHRQSSFERQNNDLNTKATYITVAKKLNNLEEPVEKYKTPPLLCTIEEKLDKVITTMNHLLYEVKLRMRDMNIKKFDTATSTVSPNVNEEQDTCIAFSLLEEEINNNEYDNGDQNEKHNMDLFQRSDRMGVKDNTTINMAHINSFPVSINKTNDASISRQDPSALALGKSNTKLPNQKNQQNESFENVLAQIKTSSLKNSDKDANSAIGDHFTATPKSIEDRLSAVDQSIIDIKMVSKSFMEDLLRSKQNLADGNYDIPTTSNNEQNSPIAISEENIVNRNIGNIKLNNKAKNQQFCCAVTNISGMQRPQYRHASVANNAEMLEDVRCSDDPMVKNRHPHTHVPVDQAVSKLDKNIIETCDKCISTKLLITVDRAVSKIDENLFIKKNYQQNCILVDRAVSKIDDIILEEMKKSNQAKKDINDLINRQFANNYGVQITFEIPTKEKSTEVTDSLSTAIVSSKSSSKGKVFFSNPPRRSPLTIAAVNTDPMSLQGLFRLSADTMRQLLAVIYSGYSSYLPSMSRTLPMVGEAMQYLCYVCGAAFRRPSELSNHMRDHHLDTARDCCVCRHMLQLRERSPGVFACRFCRQVFTRAYCCELHERSCLRRCGRRLDVSDSRAILK